MIVKIKKHPADVWSTGLLLEAMSGAGGVRDVVIGGFPVFLLLVGVEVAPHRVQAFADFLGGFGRDCDGELLAITRFPPDLQRDLSVLDPGRDFERAARDVLSILPFSSVRAVVEVAGLDEAAVGEPDPHAFVVGEADDAEPFVGLHGKNHCSHGVPPCVRHMTRFCPRSWQNKNQRTLHSVIKKFGCQGDVTKGSDPVGLDPFVCSLCKKVVFGEFKAEITELV